MHVTIYEKVQAIDGTIQKILLNETDVPKEDGYIKLPDYIYNSDKVIEVDVDVMDENGNIIIHDEIDLVDAIESVPTDWITQRPVCHILCNGTTYAYTVSLDNKERWGQPTGTGAISIRGGQYPPSHQDTDAYRWMTSTEWNNLRANSAASGNGHGSFENEETFAHYGLPNNYNGAVDGINVKRVTVSDAQTLELIDKNGARITQSIGGQVYGIKKTMGAYKKHVTSVESHTSGDSYCGQYATASIANITPFANNKVLNSDVYERQYYTENALFCKESRPLSGGGSGPGSGGGTLRDMVYRFIDIFPVDPGNGGGTGPVIGGDATIFDQLAKLRLSLEDDIPNTTDVPWWPGDNISAIRFYQVKRCATTGEIATHDWDGPLTIYRDDLKNEDGSIKNMYINFEKGLYDMEFIDDEQNMERVFFEASKTEKQAYGQNNYFNQTIYPVPLSSPSFDIEMEATANVHFNYIVQGINGTIYYQESNVSLGKGETISRKINTDNIPSFSTVVHRFEFSDGSIKTVNTQKF